MSEKWKSQPKKFCEICKCWFGDNKASIQHHENGMRHKAGVQQKLRDLGKKSREREAESKEANSYLAQMERAALESYKKDLAESAQLGASYGLHPTIGPSLPKDVKRPVPKPAVPKVMFPEAAEFNYGQPPLPQTDSGQAGGSRTQNSEMKIDLSKKWAEAITPEGFSYYWRSDTGETTWEVPKEGFISLADQQALEKKETSTSAKVKAEKDDSAKNREGVMNDIMSAAKESEETIRRRAEWEASQRPNFVAGVACPAEPLLPKSIPLPPDQAPSTLPTKREIGEPSNEATQSRQKSPEPPVKKEPIGVDDRRKQIKIEPDEGNEEIERLMKSRKEPTSSPFGSWQTVEPVPSEESRRNAVVNDNNPSIPITEESVLEMLEQTGDPIKLKAETKSTHIKKSKEKLPSKQVHDVIDKPLVVEPKIKECGEKEGGEMGGGGDEIEDGEIVCEDPSLDTGVKSEVIDYKYPQVPINPVLSKKDTEKKRKTMEIKQEMKQQSQKSEKESPRVTKEKGKEKRKDIDLFTKLEGKKGDTSERRKERTPKAEKESGTGDKDKKKKRKKDQKNEREHGSLDKEIKKKEKSEKCANVKGKGNAKSDRSTLEKTGKSEERKSSETLARRKEGDRNPHRTHHLEGSGDRQKDKEKERTSGNNNAEKHPEGDQFLPRSEKSDERETLNDLTSSETLARRAERNKNPHRRHHSEGSGQSQIDEEEGLANGNNYADKQPEGEQFGRMKKRKGYGARMRAIQRYVQKCQQRKSLLPDWLSSYPDGEGSWFWRPTIKVEPQQGPLPNPENTFHTVTGLHGPLHSSVVIAPPWSGIPYHPIPIQHPIYQAPPPPVVCYVKETVYRYPQSNETRKIREKRALTAANLTPIERPRRWDQTPDMHIQKPASSLTSPPPVPRKIPLKTTDSSHSMSEPNMNPSEIDVPRKMPASEPNPLPSEKKIKVEPITDKDETPAVVSKPILTRLESGFQRMSEIEGKQPSKDHDYCEMKELKLEPDPMEVCSESDTKSLVKVEPTDSAEENQNAADGWMGFNHGDIDEAENEPPRSVKRVKRE